MKKTSTVVVPVDLATGSRLGFDSGLQVAELLGADRVHLVHVIRDLSLWMRDVASYSGPAVLDALEAIRKSAESRLDEIASCYTDLPITREARIGAPAREIVGAANDCGGDLIVIAAGKHTGLGRLVLGSVAQTVVRAAHCPVLIVGDDHPWKQPKRILTAVDLSAVSEDVLERSMEFASAASAPVTVLSIFDLLWIAPTWHATAALPLNERELAAIAVEHRAKLDSLIERVRIPGVDVSRDLTKEHPPAKVIVDRARDIGADLIVLGSSGHSAWQRMFLGSTATRVLSHAPCPVLVVPSGDE